MTRLLLLATLFLTAATAQADGKHFLWRVSKGSQVMYIAGSVHVLRRSDYPLAPILESSYRSAAGLVEEIDLSRFDPDSAQLEMQRLGAYPPGQSLKTALSPEVYQRVMALAAKQKVDMAMIDPMRPWLASLVILDTQVSQTGYDAQSGLDMHYTSEAKADGKPIIGLEDPDYQLGLMASLSDKSQQDLLVQSLDESAGFDQEMQTIIQAWHAGDTAAIDKEMQQEFGGYPEIYQAVLVKRNAAWVPKLEALMQSGKTYFVVVGTLHLVGPDGLIARLQKDGYKAEQL